MCAGLSTAWLAGTWVSVCSPTGERGVHSAFRLEEKARGRV